MRFAKYTHSSRILLSKRIHNELLYRMFKVFHKEMASEKKCDYVAIVADETTDLSNEQPLLIVLRYIPTEKPVARFWNFVSATGRIVVSIVDSIFKEIHPQ